MLTEFLDGQRKRPGYFTDYNQNTPATGTCDRLRACLLQQFRVPCDRPGTKRNTGMMIGMAAILEQEYLILERDFQGGVQNFKCGAD
jgi:hypothetical protein